MSILASEVLTHVNGLLFPNQTGVASIDVELRDVLKKLSADGLLETSATLTLTASTAYATKPTGLIAVKSIHTPDETPLKLIAWTLYQSLIAADDDEDLPERWVLHNDLIYVYPTPATADAALTWTIDYYRLHPDDVASVLFTEEFRQCIYDGVTALVARNKAQYEKMRVHQALYSEGMATLSKARGARVGHLVGFDV